MEEKVKLCVRKCISDSLQEKARLRNKVRKKEG